MNKMNTNETLNRMKSLMNYGLQTESKQAPYSSVEYQKKGADGKVYGIVREGAKYYIKSAPNKTNLVKEDFNYIGGFRNRKDNEYSSYANAQKQFDLKMMSLKEAYNNPTFNVESWDLNKKESVVIEASDKMRGEILRERQIMKNATVIAEAKKGECHGIGCEIANTQKDNIKAGKPETGDAKKADKTFCEDGKPSKEQGCLGEQSNRAAKKAAKKAGRACAAEAQKAAMAAANAAKAAGSAGSASSSKLDESEVLGWHDSHGNPKGDHYMDKSHGTEIGDSAPFDDAKGKQITDNGNPTTKTGEAKNGVVEGTSMHDADNQNTPTPGVGNIGKNDPFDGEKGKQIDEAIDDLEGGEDMGGAGADDMGGEDPMAGGADDMGAGADDMGGEGEDFGSDDLGGEGEPIGDDEFGDEDLEGDDELDGDDLEGDDDDLYEDDLESRMDALEELLGAIADKLGVETPGVDADNYEDDDLFDDEEGGEFDDEYGDEGEDFGGEGEDFGDEEPIGDEGEDVGGEYGDEGEDFGDEEPIEDDVDFETMGENRRRRGDVQIFETKAFKRAMRRQRMNEEGMTPFTDNGRVPSGNMNKLNDFGKHPAYQKKVMELPPKDMQEFPGYYDMNDDSVRNDNPYGEKIGDGSPFNIDPQAVDNAIAEAFNRLKKKDNRRRI